MLLHSPFEFANIKGRKMRDRVSQSDWDILFHYGKVFENPLPRSNLPSYSIHVNLGVHLAICKQANATALCAFLDITNEWLYP
jgi:hypothetical protein